MQRDLVAREPPEHPFTSYILITSADNGRPQTRRWPLTLHGSIAATSTTFYMFNHPPYPTSKRGRIFAVGNAVAPVKSVLAMGDHGSSRVSAMDDKMAQSEVSYLGPFTIGALHGMIYKPKYLRCSSDPRLCFDTTIHPPLSISSFTNPMSATNPHDPRDRVNRPLPPSGNPLSHVPPTSGRSPAKTLRKKRFSEDLRKEYKDEEDSPPSPTTRSTKG